MSGGGDSEGVGTGRDTTSPRIASGATLAGRMAAAGGGIGRLTPADGGNHVEQHIDACGQPPGPF